MSELRMTYAGLAHDGADAKPVGGQQNDAGAPDMLLGGIVRVKRLEPPSDAP